MVIIEKAILHILDFTSDEPVLSQQELDLDLLTLEFITKHVEKNSDSQDAQTGIFKRDSAFQKLLVDYIAQTIDFVTLSQEIAKGLFAEYGRGENMQTTDVFICQGKIEDVPQLIILKSQNNVGYIHQIRMEEENTITQLVNSSALLPNLNQKMEEFVFVNLDSKEILFKAKKHLVEGFQKQVLADYIDCIPAPSPAATLKEIHKIAQKVADAYCQDQVETAVAVKNCIKESVQEEGELNPQAVGENIFQSNPSMQADFQQEIVSAGFTEPVKVDPAATMKKICRQKISTDTGIEINIPTEFFEDTDYVEFFKNEDGTMSIAIKNIQNISSR